MSLKYNYDWCIKWGIKFVEAAPQNMNYKKGKKLMRLIPKATDRITILLKEVVPESKVFN